MVDAQGRCLYHLEGLVLIVSRVRPRGRGLRRRVRLKTKKG